MFEAQCELQYGRAAARVQPTLLREEPFPNFIDALGKCFSLAASSPRYLRRLGLLQGDQVWALPARLNRLYLQGLRVIFLLPVFYVLDRYRVEVLAGHIRADDNEAFWRWTELYTGAMAPRQRTNEQFDLPAKLLQEVDDQYTRLDHTVLLYMPNPICISLPQSIPQHRAAVSAVQTLLQPDGTVCRGFCGKAARSVRSIGSASDWLDSTARYVPGLRRTLQRSSAAAAGHA